MDFARLLSLSTAKHPEKLAKATCNATDDQDEQEDAEKILSSAL